MRGCSDTCAARIRRIQAAGLSKCLAMGRAKGRADPERDRVVIKKAALIGYKETARLVGCSDTTVKTTVVKYSEYAELILAGQAEKG